MKKIFFNAGFILTGMAALMLLSCATGASTYLKQGKLAVERGNYEQAVLDFSTMLEMTPDSAEALYNRGNAYFAMKQYEQAIADFEAALRIIPNHVNSSQGIERVRQAQIEERAQESIEKGDRYMEQGNYAQAIFEYESALHIFANHAGASQGIEIARQAVHTRNIEDFGADATINAVYNAANATEWYAVVQAIANGGNNRNYIINITDDFELPGNATTTGTFSARDITVSIRGNQTISLSGAGRLLVVSSSQNIIIRDLNLRGNSSNNFPLVNVSIGTLTMKDNASIHSNKNESDNGGGGVYVSNGTFTMQDNTSVHSNISITRYGNGGGVNIQNSGRFIMRDFASLYNNSAIIGGGAIVYGTFYISGGIIYGNEAANGEMRNTSNSSNAAISIGNNATAQYGTFTGDDFTSNGSLSTRNATVRVVNGNLQ